MKVVITMEFEGPEQAGRFLLGEPSPFTESLDDVNLSVRARNMLDSEFPDVKTVGDLAKITRRDLFRTRNCGPMTVKEIAMILKLRGMPIL